jgi:predicted nucleic acid-binding protein
MIVIDASALVELLVGDTPRAARLATRVSQPNESLHAPELIDVEVLSALRKLEARGTDQDQIEIAASLLVRVPLRRYLHRTFLGRAWSLRFNASTYDAMYLALAEMIAAPLVTCDANLANAPGHRATVELFA